MAEQIRASQEPTCDCGTKFPEEGVVDPHDTALTPYAEQSHNNSQSSGGAPSPFGPAKR